MKNMLGLQSEWGSTTVSKQSTDHGPEGKGKKKRINLIVRIEIHLELYLSE